MSALRRAPGVHLRGAPLVLLRRMPTDRGRVEQHLRTHQAGDARGFRIPLIPADQDADRRVARLPHLEAGRVARSKVVLLVEQRIVRDVHLPVGAHDAAVGVDDGRRVAIDARGLPLEDRHNQHDRELAREPRHRVGGRAGDALSEIEAFRLLRLAEVRRVEHLLQADDLRPLRRGAADQPFRPSHVGRGIVGRVILDDSDREHAARGGVRRLTHSLPRSARAARSGRQSSSRG